MAVLILIYVLRKPIFKKLVKAYLAVIRSFLYKILVKPVVLALPSAVLAIYKIDSAKNAMPPIIIEKIDAHIVIIVFGLVIVPILSSFEDFIDSKSSKYDDNISTEGLFLLLSALDSPVDKKMDRFLTALNKSTCATSPGKIFNKITEPEKQLAEITRAIHILLEGLYKIENKDKVDIVTVVFRMKNNRSRDVWSYYPESQIPESDLISDQKSLASYSAKNKRMTIISDIKAEKKKKNRKISEYCNLEEGSAICYPINTGHTKEIPLVIRITANKQFFDEEKREIYIKVLEVFKKRILIEYALSELKDRATDKANI
ncbi:hypothetical protein [Methylotuvimicrobium buryatense]|uniref:GAF domain-containing protein n=1 Tax=Methylotuvimicrobium buryatense TaxID=95641 RepID=A0A4P9UPF1_METBY|nr:hypothetical protein [Methylotuvimicrobium buryatense]QCW83264.1 hypothetical protein EQU24_14200 [Methylotuvimicrobium buryatense]